jgi:hypothetical protein
MMQINYIDTTKLDVLIFGTFGLLIIIVSAYKITQHEEI